MATISSHILDNVTGKSAAGIGVQLFVIEGEARRELFDVIADREGRIAEQVDTGNDRESTEYELVFHSADYFADVAGFDQADDVMKTVVLRFSMPDRGKRYHMPIMLSPHSYSVWWSQ